MSRAGKPRPVGKQVSHAEFRRMWNDRSLTLAQIGAELGITATAVTFRAKTRGLPPRGCSKLHLSPIIPAREAEFRAMYLGNVQSKALMAHFGVTGSTITKTAARLGLPPRGKAWSHMGITIEQWREARLAARMAATAAATKAALEQAGMQHAQRPVARAA